MRATPDRESTSATMPRADPEQEQYGPRGVATPMLASRVSKSGRATATTLEHKGLTQTGVRMYVNKSDGEPALTARKDAAARALEGVESILQESPVGDRRANGSRIGRQFVIATPTRHLPAHTPRGPVGSVLPQAHLATLREAEWSTMVHLEHSDHLA